MILCVNLNAAIDKTITIDGFDLGRIHRPLSVKSLAGGKGCNVARALRTLGENPIVTGWVGGTAGQFIEKRLQAEGIETDFVHTAAESRTCLSILDTQSQVLTEIYERGEPISAEKKIAMLEQFRKMVGRVSAVALSGSLPPGIASNFYAQLIHIAHGANVPVFLDSSDRALVHGVLANPFLVKPNQAEVSALVDQPLSSVADFAAAATQIARRHRTTVVLSLGAKGAIVADADHVHHLQPPSVEAKSAVGSGDSLLAGLMYGVTRGWGLVESAKMGVAVGTANTLQIGAGQFATQDVERILPRIVVTDGTAPTTFSNPSNSAVNK